MKTFAIIGTGAVGGYCAIKLIQAGFDVHCLLNSDYEHVKKNGLVLIDPDGNVAVPVKAYNHANQMPCCDVIIVSIKTTANPILKDILPPLMHDSSVVVILQNGIGIEDEIASFIDSNKIIGASSLIKVTKISPGTIQYFGFGIMEFAQYYKDEKRSATTKNVEQLAVIFNKIGYQSTAMPHLNTIRWKKLAANIPVSGLSVVLNANTQQIVQDEASYNLLIAMTKEVIESARTCGADIPSDFLSVRIKIIEQLKSMEPSNFSMKDDFDQKKPLELHAIYENAIQIAKKHQVQMPLTEMLYYQLVYLDGKNRKF